MRTRYWGLYDYCAKPRKLPPEAQAVIDAVKRYDVCGTGWRDVIDALRAYEACK